MNQDAIFQTVDRHEPMREPPDALDHFPRTMTVEPSREARVAAALIVGTLSLAAGTLGGLVHTSRRSKMWYRLLRKPRATPPSVAFRIVWPALYGLSALSVYRVWRAPATKTRRMALGLWGAQLAFNGAWTPLFFGAERPRLAMADLVALGLSLGAYTVAAAKVDRTAALLVVPYLGWTGFAGYLNGSIVARNRGPVRNRLTRG
jgi:tryptophan-rich sensory protein